MTIRPSSPNIFDYEHQTFELTNYDTYLIKGKYEYIKFNHCVFNFEINIDAEVSGKVEFVECEFLGERPRLIILGGNYNDEFTASFRSLLYLGIIGGQFKHIHIGYWGSETKIEEIDIHNIQKISGRITLSSIRSEKILIFGTNTDCEFDIYNSFFRRVSLYNFSNRNVFKLKFIKPNEVGSKISQFNIQESNLDKAEFYNVNFSEFGEFNIRNSYLSNTLFIDCSLPNSVNAKVGRGIVQPLNIDSLNLDKMNAESELSGEIPTEHTKSEIIGRIKKIKENIALEVRKDQVLQIGYRKENYKQLKYAFSKQGDKINERLYHGKEMEEYLKMDIPIFDKAVIGISKWSSDFGQSILRPIIFNGLIHVLFCLILFTFWGYNYCKFQFTVCEPNWDITKYLLNEGLYLFMPLKGFVKEFLLIDIFMKINSGLFLYNMIRATRKFYL